MSPEYKQWLDMPKELRVEVRNSLENVGLNLDSSIKEGFYLLLNEDKTIKKFIFCSDSDRFMTESQKKDALKQKSPWHKLDGFECSSKREKFKPNHNRHIKEYRGNHRSHTRGIWTLRNMHVGGKNRKLEI